MDPTANPLQQLGYQAPDLDRFVFELALDPQKQSLEALLGWPDECPQARSSRIRSYGRLLALATRSQPIPGIIDLYLEQDGSEPTVRPAQMLTGGEVLLAEGLSLGQGRNCRFNIPLWIWALFPAFAADLESGYAQPFA